MLVDLLGQQPPGRLGLAARLLADVADDGDAEHDVDPAQRRVDDHGDRAADLDREAQLLAHLAHDGVGGRLAAVEQATGQAPAVPVRLAQHEQPAVALEQAHGADREAGGAGPHERAPHGGGQAPEDAQGQQVERSQRRRERACGQPTDD